MLWVDATAPTPASEGTEGEGRGQTYLEGASQHQSFCHVGELFWFVNVGDDEKSNLTF